MRAVVCKAWGPPEALVVEDVPAPTPGAGEVLIGVRACGVNFADTLTVQGKYQEKPPLPFIPGLEVAGDVLATGEGVTGFAPDQRVAALCATGGYAQVVAAPADRDGSNSGRNALRNGRRIHGCLRYRACRAVPPRSAARRRDAPRPRGGRRGRPRCGGGRQGDGGDGHRDGGLGGQARARGRARRRSRDRLSHRRVPGRPSSRLPAAEEPTSSSTPSAATSSASRCAASRGKAGCS